MAAAFIANDAIIYYRSWLLEPRSEASSALISFHTAISISVLVFVACRIVWHWMESQPEPVSGSELEHKAAHVVHILLYAVMIILPLSGYLGAGGPSQLFGLIEVLRFADTSIHHTVVKGWMGLTWEKFESPIDFIHKQGGPYLPCPARSLKDRSVITAVRQDPAIPLLPNCQFT